MKPSVNESEGPHRFRLLTACHQVLHPIALDQSNSAIALPGMIMSLSLILTVYVVIYGAGLYTTVNILRRAPAEQEKGPRPSLGQDSAAQDKAMETA
jgi:cytochrome bd-type quinol oxidase subunit 1